MNNRNRFYLSARFCLIPCLLLPGLICGGNNQPGRALHFSAEPADAEISGARIFDEPLLASSDQSSPRENRALAEALSAYANRADFDDFSALTTFLRSWPQSRWCASVQLHLGVEYYNSGYYSKALSAWEQAWQQFEPVTSGPAKAQADRALAELARLYSKLGRMTELTSLLDSTHDRPLEGPATQMVDAARQALWMMQTRPEKCFRCGPLALERILAHSDPAKAANPLIAQSRSTTNGFSLLEVAALSRQLGMNYQVAFRSPGAEILFPAVVHWKAGHYAALLRKEQARFLVRDSTFWSDFLMTQTALDEEASGYFLVPPGPLPRGWRTVSENEARTIRGKGNVNNQTPGAHSHCDHKSGGNCGSSPMTTYAMHTMLVSLSLNDTPVGYAPPVGPPVRFTATYSQRESDQPATFYYSNLGQKWTCNWISYITDNPTTPNAPSVMLYVDGGGTFTFSGFNTANQTYAPERMTHALLTKTASDSYQMLYPDGSRTVFSASDGSVGTSRRIFLTQIIDPAGNAVQLNYDTQLRITNIIDAIGQPTTLFYTNAAYPYAITEVMDPFGRAAYLEYNSSGRLSQITDILGLSSQFNYSTNDFINALTTPYGITTFATGVTNGVIWLQATDPLGASELLEFNDNTPIASVDPVAVVPHGIGALNNYLIFRNSLFWDKKAYQEGAGDLTKAKITHFLHEVDINVESPVIESIKQPLENRVWFTYLGQSAGNIVSTNARPSFVARVLDDGTTQVAGYQYNPFGKLTSATDPAGRTFSFIYASNNLDLLEVRMTRNGKNELLSRTTYNSQHLPLTVTDAAGQTTTNTYNARGQLLSISNPKGETTTFAYDPSGYLLAITGPLQTTSDVTAFTYDAFGRPGTVTDTEGYVLTMDYDAFDRPTRVTYPDTTFEQFVYDRLDLTATRDRLGRWTTNLFNANRQLVQSGDPLGRITFFNWCKCGVLAGLTDPMGRTTTWRYDVQSRLLAKQYPDGSAVTYTYENSTSRLKDRRDEKGQDTLYEYYPDDNLRRISYPNATTSTPTVTYAYDPDYNRLLSVQDGIGTTTYAYNPITSAPALGAARLALVTGPLPDSAVSYQYDELGRVSSRAINGVGLAVLYDPLGRPITVTNSLGAFHYSYLRATPRVASELYPNGQTSLFTYYDNPGDQRLKQIQNLRPDASLLSSFGYAYNPAGDITSWTNQWDSLPTRVWSASYDPASQLTNVLSSGGISQPTNYTYLYDPAGNRLATATNGVQNAFNYNSLNQLVDSSPGATNSATYEWDAENRLAAINQGSNRSEFSYDGLGRRVQILEKANGIIVSNSFYLWCGSEICEQRDATGTNVIGRFFPEGEQLLSLGSQPVNLYYTRDHLGSIREALDGSGTVAARYDYDPFGMQTILQQSLGTTFAYTGHFLHSPSGLYLTFYRGYDAATGRWLSRDALGEAIGPNLYSYVANSPLSLNDPFGLSFWDDLQPWERFKNATIGLYSGAATGALVGSVIPGAGTAGGAVFGAIAGGLSGLLADPCASGWSVAGGAALSGAIAPGVGVAVGAAAKALPTALGRFGLQLTQWDRGQGTLLSDLGAFIASPSDLGWLYKIGTAPISRWAAGRVSGWAASTALKTDLRNLWNGVGTGPEITPQQLLNENLNKGLKSTMLQPNPSCNGK